MRKLMALTITTALMIATVAFAQMAPTKIGDSAKGKVLTNDQGMTLYVFDKDSAANPPATVLALRIGRR